MEIKKSSGRRTLSFDFAPDRSLNGFCGAVA